MTTVTAFTCIRDGIHFVDAWFENVKQADQIVIQDGGSTDGTVECLLELRKTHPNCTILLQEETNAKYDWNEMNVRNQCLNLFRMDFILLTDVDELVEDGFWEWAKTDHDKNGYYLPHKNLWGDKAMFNIQPKWYPDVVMRFFRNFNSFVWCGEKHASVWRLQGDTAIRINPSDEDIGAVPNDIHLVHYHRAEKGYYEAIINDRSLHHSNEKVNLRQAPILARLRKEPNGAGLIKRQFDDNGNRVP